MAEEKTKSSPPLGEISAAGTELGPFFRSWMQGLRQPADKLLQARGGDWSIYEDVRRDDQVKAAMQQRRGAVVSRAWSVEAGGDSALDKQAAAALEEDLKEIPWDAICGRMLWGVYFGWSVAELIWTHRKGRYAWSAIKVRKRSRFAWHWDGTLRLLTVDTPEGTIMPAKKFWTFATGDDNDDDPYGLGLAHWLYWPVFFKKNDLKVWLIFLEKFGQPTPIGKYPPGATPDQKDDLLAAAAAIATEAAVTMPEDMKMELLEAKRSGAGDYATMLATMNAAITKVVLSQTLTTDVSTDGGSRALGDVHAGVRDDVVNEDADLLCESFNTGPVQWWTEFNFPGAKPPRVWRRAEDDTDLKPIADRDKVLFDMGYEPTPQYMKETYGEGFQKKKKPEAKPGARRVDGIDEAADDDAPPAEAELAERGVCPIHGRRHSAAELAEGAREPDAIDELVDSMLAEWEPAMAPVIEPLLALAETCSSFDEFRRRLPELAGAMDTKKLEDLMARGAFAARIAGDRKLLGNDGQ
jgi:phage gp29-like protein